MQTNTAIIVAIISACAGALLGWSLASKSSSSDSSSNLTGLTFIKQAICTFNANDKVTGSLEFTQSENDPWVDVRGKLTGSEVPDGNHGFHVHVAGNLGDGCKAAKGHYNPMSLDHGSPQANERHNGDLGNIGFTSGQANVIIRDRLLSLNGPMSIIGRSIVVHQLADDMGLTNGSDSKTTGSAGPRLACCVIGLN